MQEMPGSFSDSDYCHMCPKDFVKSSRKSKKSGQRKWKVDFLTSKPYAGVAKRNHLPWGLYIFSPK